jgi:hypothetical protein
MRIASKDNTEERFQMKDANWPYLAAMIDGEGHIGITKGCRYEINKDGVRTKYPAYTLQISVSNNSVALMRYLIQHFGGVFYIHKRSNPNARIGYIWQPKGLKNKETLLLSVLPYLVIKPEQAKLALEFIRMNGQINPEKRGAMHERSRQLNQRGISVETNMPNCPENGQVRESELRGDTQSAPVVIRGYEEFYEETRGLPMQMLEDIAATIPRSLA